MHERLMILISGAYECCSIGINYQSNDTSLFESSKLRGPEVRYVRGPYVPSYQLSPKEPQHSNNRFTLQRHHTTTPQPQHNNLIVVLCCRCCVVVLCLCCGSLGESWHIQQATVRRLTWQPNSLQICNSPITSPRPFLRGTNAITISQMPRGSC